MSHTTVDKMLTVEQFAKRVGKTRESVRTMIEKGEIVAEDHRNPGSSRAKYRIDPKEEARWRKSRQTSGNRRPPPTSSSPSRGAASPSVELFV